MPYQDEEQGLAGIRQALGAGGAPASPTTGASPIAGPQPLTPRPQSPAGPSAPGQPASGAMAGGGAGQTPTFASLQASGIARPAPPPAAPAPMGAGGYNPGDPTLPTNQTGGAPSYTQVPYQDTYNQEHVQDDPTGSGGSTGGTGGETGSGGTGGTGGTGATGGTGDGKKPPVGDPGGGGGSGDASIGNGNQYPLQPDIEAAIRKMLGAGSSYDDSAFQNDVGREYNKIDDEYALGQKGLTDELARRGLGSSTDSTIGLGRTSDLNVGRKSAKETVLSSLSSARARQQSDDMARILGLATSYGQGAAGLSLDQKQQQFNTQLAIAQLLAQLGYKPAAQAGG